MTTTEPIAHWYARLPQPAIIGQISDSTLRCFNGTDPVMTQPALDENVISIHLGGAKRVNRWQDGRRQTWDVPLNSVTLMPAHRANRWHTEGVIAFTHLSLGTDFLARLAREEFDRDPRDLTLQDRVGVVDPLMSELMLTLNREVAAPGLRQLYRDSLLVTLGITVLKRYATLDHPQARTQTRTSLASAGLARGGLAGWQLRRVLEHMTAHLTQDVGLDDLVRITGLSRAQFFRAFRRSTGNTPASHMRQLRMRHAGVLLMEGYAISDVAQKLGYCNVGHFAAVFRHEYYVNPSEWRRQHDGVDAP